MRLSLPLIQIVAVLLLLVGQFIQSAPVVKTEPQTQTFQE